MIVEKFGGTSLGNPSRIRHVVELCNDGQPKIVVLSAMSGTTNALESMCTLLYQDNKAEVSNRLEELSAVYAGVIDDLFASQDYRKAATEMLRERLDHIRAYTLDMFTPFEERAILAQGELISTALVQLYCEESGIESHLLPALDFMRIDQNHEPDYWYIKSNLERLLKESKGVLYITQGYICRNHFGEIDNLKRGGSDYTASIIGVAVAAEKIQIWTDIDGMHNNDPRIVEETRPIERLTFDEAAELAYFGAKILHPSSVLPARKANIPVVLKNTLDSNKKGTVISNEPSGDFIKAVAAKDGITAIKIKSERMLLAYGFLRRVFEVFERHQVAIDMITTSEVAVSLTIDTNKDISPLVGELESYGIVEVDNDQGIVCVVGHLLQSEEGHAAKIFDALREIPLRMISYGGSKNNVSILINAEHKAKTLKALNQGLFKLDLN
ncbi:MAG: aspartate kinase [Salibacteraceae bacterium]